MRHEIRLAGFGGQGIILAGYILGKAACLYGNKEAVLSQSYGPEARGGACAAQVIISDEPVEYPLFEQADYLVLMFQEAFDKYGATAKTDATVIVDSDLVTPAAGDKQIIGAPFTKIAEELGNRIVANIVMLGYLIGVAGLVDREAMEESIRTQVRPQFVDLNIEAFGRGYALAREAEVVA